jgi:hypothetical protein
VSCDEELADFRDNLSLRPYVSCVSGQERSEVGERCRQGAYLTLGSGLEALLNAEKSLFEHRRTQKVPPIRNLVAQQVAAKIWYCSCGQRPPILEAFFFFEGILFFFIFTPQDVCGFPDRNPRFDSLTGGRQDLFLYQLWLLHSTVALCFL